MSMLDNAALMQAQGAVILCISSALAEAVAKELQIWNYRVVSPERFIPDGKYDEVVLVAGTLEKLSRHDRFMAELKLKTLTGYRVFSMKELELTTMVNPNKLNGLGTAPKGRYEDEVEKHLSHFRDAALGLTQKESDALTALKFNEMSACAGTCVSCKTCHAVNRATDKFMAMSPEDRRKVMCSKNPKADEVYYGRRRQIFVNRD